MKSILLARVSSKEQESNSAQTARLVQFAQQKGFENPDIYEIEESSTKADRTRFLEILEVIKRSKEPVALFVDTVDRLQRSFKESVIFDDLRRQGKTELYFYRENLHIHQNSNSADLIRWDMGVMFARSYVLQLSDNIKRRFEQKRRCGEWVANVPFGYLSIALEGSNRRREDIVRHPTNAAHVREIFNKCLLEDYSGKKIAQWLNQRGIKTNRGKEFHASGVHHILNNPFYYGDMRTGYGVYAHKYEPLIPKCIFVDVQEALARRDKNPAKSIRKNEFALSGLVKCAKCGCSITGQLTKGKYIYYSCTNAKGLCKRIYITEKALLSPVRQALKRLKLTDDQKEEILSFLKEHHSQETVYHRQHVQELQQQYVQTQDQLDRLLDLLMKKSITEQDYERKQGKLRSTLYDVSIQLDDRTKADEHYHITAKTVLSYAQRLEAVFESSEPVEKRQLLKRILQNPKVRGKKLEFELQSPFDAIANVKGHPIMRRALDAFKNLNWSEIRTVVKTLSIPLPKD